jgi:hypothetical protein
MPIKSSRYNQSIFDVAAENFGTLDNIVKLSLDNGLSLSKELKTNTELIIDNENLGEADIKNEISDNDITLNNFYDALVFLTADTTQYTADNTVITADRRQL